MSATFEYYRADKVNDQYIFRINIDTVGVRDYVFSAIAPAGMADTDYINAIKAQIQSFADDCLASAQVTNSNPAPTQLSGFTVVSPT